MVTPPGGDGIAPIDRARRRPPGGGGGGVPGGGEQSDRGPGYGTESIPALM